MECTDFPINPREYFPFLFISFFCFLLVVISFLLTKRADVNALQRVFEYVTEVLEKQLEKPSPAQSFPITFLSLATAIPSIFRFNRSSQRLATLLNRLQQHDLALGVLLSETVDNETLHPTTTTLLEVARCLI